MLPRLQAMAIFHRAAMPLWGVKHPAVPGPNHIN